MKSLEMMKELYKIRLVIQSPRLEFRENYHPPNKNGIKSLNSECNIQNPAVEK